MTPTLSAPAAWLVSNGLLLADMSGIDYGGADAWWLTEYGLQPWDTWKPGVALAGLYDAAICCAPGLTDADRATQVLASMGTALAPSGVAYAVVERGYILPGMEWSLVHRDRLWAMYSRG